MAVWASKAPTAIWAFRADVVVSHRVQTVTDVLGRPIPTGAVGFSYCARATRQNSNVRIALSQLNGSAGLVTERLLERLRRGKTTH
jgi:hypothetical protein